MCGGDPEGSNRAVGALLEWEKPLVGTAEEAVYLLVSTTMIWDWHQLRGQDFANGMTASGAYDSLFRYGWPERVLAELQESERSEHGLPCKLVLPIVATIKNWARASPISHHPCFSAGDHISAWQSAPTQPEMREQDEDLLTGLLERLDDPQEIRPPDLPGSVVDSGVIWPAAG